MCRERNGEMLTELSNAMTMMTTALYITVRVLIRTGIINLIGAFLNMEQYTQLSFL